MLDPFYVLFKQTVSAITSDRTGVVPEGVLAR